MPYSLAFAVFPVAVVLFATRSIVTFFDIPPATWPPALPIRAGVWLFFVDRFFACS